MRKSAFLALFLGTPFVLTACGDDEATGDGETGGTGTTGESRTSTGDGTRGEDTVADDTEGTGEEGCTPDDQCQTNDDCLPGQTCLGNCTCFGEPSGETEDACYDGQGEYGDCFNGDGNVCMNQNAGCIVGGQPATAGACYFNCSEACDCPPPPDDIAVGCQDLFQDGQAICFLDCTGGKPCPDDMICFSNTVCMYPGEAGSDSCAGRCGSYDANAACQCDDQCFGEGDCCADLCDECTDEFPGECGIPFPYQDCGNGGPAICHASESCILASNEDSDWGICAMVECSDARDCPEAPEGGTAPVACGDLGDGNVCYLDCSDEQNDCPDGMTCTPQGNCAFEGPGFLLYERFDVGELPGGWTVIDVDQNTPDAAVSWVTEAWVITDMIVGNHAAASTSWYDPEDQADDWIITPAITLGNNSMLSWKALAPDGDFPDGYEVRVSTVGPAVDDFGDPAVFSVAQEEQAYTYHSVDLAAEGYANEEVWIAFRNNSDNQFLLFVDDIAVTQ
jgi:hypothetical protein